MLFKEVLSTYFPYKCDSFLMMKPDNCAFIDISLYAETNCLLVSTLVSEE